MSKVNKSPLFVSFAGRLGSLALLAALSGCVDDPLERPGTWRPNFVNDANLAAMASNKSNLVRGVDDPVSPGVLSAQAVHRLLTDHVKPLPTTEIGPIGGGSSSGASAQ